LDRCELRRHLIVDFLLQLADNTLRTPDGIRSWPLLSLRDDRKKKPNNMAIDAP
jgi:hypothetical protein